MKAKENSMKANVCVRRFALVLAVGLLYVFLGHAETPAVLAQASTGTLRVATTGTDATGCGSAASPCRTIQYAIDQTPFAGSGTILVAAGTYNSLNNCVPNTGPAVVCILNKRITLWGGYGTSNWGTPNPSANVTIIDGQNSGRGVLIQTTGPGQPQASLDMEGFTIQNGLAQGATNGSDNLTFAYGGGLFATHTQVTLRNMTFMNNKAVGGSTSQAYGGVGAGGGVSLNADTWSTSFATATLQNVIFDSNQSIGGTGATRGGQAHGAGLFTSQVTTTGSNLTFTNNTVTAGSSSGGGATGDGQKADALGGALSVEQGSAVTLQTITATGNKATGGDAPGGEPGGAYGGAFFVENASFTLSDANVNGNTAQGGNGANSSGAAALAEGGALQSVGATITLNRVAIVNNTAKSGNGTSQAGAAGGGGIALTYSNNPFSITNAIITDNTAALGTGRALGGGGGGIWLQGVTGNIVHATIARNIIDLNLLGAGVVQVYAGGWPNTASINYSILSDHTQTGNPYMLNDAAVYVQPSATINLATPLFFNNTHNTNSGGYTVGTINISNPVAARSLGYVSPGAPNYNYHIMSTSGAVDQAAGSTTPDDVDNQSRPYGKAPDVGADEYSPFNVGVTPGDGYLNLSWSSASQMVAGALDHYDLVVTCPSGAQPPNQGACGQPMNAGTKTSFTLTGLTNFDTYTLTVNARNSQNSLILFGTALGTPTNMFVYLPLVVR